jgi:hypothetical protein
MVSNIILHTILLFVWDSISTGVFKNFENFFNHFDMLM